MTTKKKKKQFMNSSTITDVDGQFSNSSTLLVLAHSLAGFGKISRVNFCAALKLPLIFKAPLLASNKVGK
jgi:hypothetical protein